MRVEQAKPPGHPGVDRGCPDRRQAVDIALQGRNVLLGHPHDVPWARRAPLVQEVGCCDRCVVIGRITCRSAGPGIGIGVRCHADRCGLINISVGIDTDRQVQAVHIRCTMRVNCIELAPQRCTQVDLTIKRHDADGDFVIAVIGQNRRHKGAGSRLQVLDLVVGVHRAGHVQHQHNLDVVHPLFSHRMARRVESIDAKQMQEHRLGIGQGVGGNLAVVQPLRHRHRRQVLRQARLQKVIIHHGARVQRLVQRRRRQGGPVQRVLQRGAAGFITHDVNRDPAHHDHQHHHHDGKDRQRAILAPAKGPKPVPDPAIEQREGKSGKLIVAHGTQPQKMACLPVSADRATPSCNDHLSLPVGQNYGRNVRAMG